MAGGFTAQLNQPTNVSGGGGSASSSTLGAVGDLIGNAANIGGKILDKMQARDAAAAGSDVSNKLTDLVRENFGATPSGSTPDLVGTPSTDVNANAAASSPVVQNTMSSLNRLDQANKQGALSPQELFTRGSVLVQDAINKNPLFAQEIRQAAQGVLGVQPTQELVKLAEEDSTRAKALAADVKHGNVMAAANAGITYIKPDGQFDFDQMASAGSLVQFQDKQLADQMKIAQLNKEQMPEKATNDERLAAEITPFIKNANPVFEKTVDGMMSSVPSLIQKYANQGKDQQVAQVLQAVGTQQAQMNNWLDKQILNNNVSPDAATKLRSYYNAPFESMKVLSSSGDFSSFTTTSAALKRMNDTGQMDFRTSMPITAKIKDAGGDQAVASMFSVFLGTNTPLREGVNGEANTFLNGAHPATVMANGANAMAGNGYNLSQEQNPDVQAKTLKGLVGTLSGYTQKPNSLAPNEQTAYGHITNQITALGLQSNDPKNLSTAANLTNTPAYLATFDNFAKSPDNANQVPIVAQGVIALNTKSIMRQAPSLVQGTKITLAGRPELRDPMDMMMDAGMPGSSPISYGPPIEVTAVARFNSVTGKAEPVVFALAGGKKVQLTPDEYSTMVQKMGDFNTQLATVNRSLDAVQHMSPNGVGREKDFKPLELRQLLASGAGIPMKPGMQPVPMPKFMQPKKQADVNIPQPILDAQIQQESGGQNGLVSDKGAVGIAQIRPQDFPQYDAEKLKNDPEYALKARNEIMSDLVRKHKGSVPLALAEYHGGPDKSNWGPKTFGYVSSILSKAGETK